MKDVMKKPIYFIKAKFETFAELTDFNEDEKAEVVEALEWLPSCKLRLGFETGKFLDIDGGPAYAKGNLSHEISDKKLKIVFDGWFKVDCNKRRDFAEDKIADALKTKSPILLLEFGAGQYIFEGKNSSLVDGESVLVEGVITKDLPDVKFD